jgi:hypothetical protein
VTVFAALLERALVRINVAVETSLELHVLVTCRPAWHIRLMALLASNLNM